MHKDHKGHKDRERDHDGGASHSALQLTRMPVLIVVAGMALGEMRRPWVKVI